MLAAAFACQACGASGGGGGGVDDAESDDTTPHTLDALPPSDVTDEDGAPIVVDDTDVDSATLDAPDVAPPDTSDTFDVFDGAPPDVVDTGGCTPKCTTCGADDGCGGRCATGACGAGATCVGFACVAPTTSYLSPLSYPSSWGAFARGISWTIASESPSTIHLTTDGSAPSAGSGGGASPHSFAIGTSGTTVKWFADDGAPEATHAFVVKIDATLQNGYGYVVEDVKFDGKSPVVVAAAGATLDGSAKYQAWVGTGCPLCRQQLVYGFGTTPSGCLYDWSPGTFPGASGTAATHLVAPSAAGVYRLRVAWALENSCVDAMTGAKNPLGVKPTTDMGVVVVRP